MLNRLIEQIDTTLVFRPARRPANVSRPANMSDCRRWVIHRAPAREGGCVADCAVGVTRRSPLGTVSSVGMVVCLAAVFVVLWWWLASAPLAAAAGWSIQPTPNPVDATSGYLLGVSCASRTACTAVGHYFDAAHGPNRPVLERWDGARWSIQPTPTPVGAILSGVSCTAPSACTAVGTSSSPSARGPGPNRTLVERWDGESWSIQPTPNPTVASLLSVSCAAPRACTAVAAPVPSARGLASRPRVLPQSDGTGSDQTVAARAAQR